MRATRRGGSPPETVAVDDYCTFAPILTTRCLEMRVPMIVIINVSCLSVFGRRPTPARNKLRTLEAKENGINNGLAPWVLVWCHELLTLEWANEALLVVFLSGPHKTSRSTNENDQRRRDSSRRTYYTREETTRMLP